MYSLILVIALVNICAAEVETVENNQHTELDNQYKNHHAMHKRESNKTYANKDENMLRVPALNYYEEHKAKKKLKKSPKRTIQKIIKKNKGKLRKVYFSQVAKQTKTTASPKIDFEKVYGADEVRKWKGETSTPAHKHRYRNSKVVRYHMPFQKMQKKKEGRHKRSLSRELFIIKDLDQMEFLSKEKDNDVVNAHITDYWKV